MPSRNTIKIYIKDGIYHIYNRGVEKRIIFLDEQDYKIFLYYLKSYLTPASTIELRRSDLRNLNEEPQKILKPDSRWRSDLHKKIKLLSYCLMPNHFHLIMKQSTERAIVEFMRRLTNAYVKYFNDKYDRTGPLFQGRYKAVLIDSESYFFHLSYYIHYNPVELFKNDKDAIEKVENYPYSSYADYLGKRNTKWIDKELLMEDFKKGEEEIKNIEENRKILGKLTLE
ncbi:MAG: transposase [Patescibacteria group bacterium]